MRILSIDQSLAGCAFVVVEENGDPVFKDVIQTTHSDNPKPWQKVFPDLNRQMIYIADTLWEAAVSFQVEYMVMESLSMGSLGDQTRNLAGLFHVIQTTFIRNGFDPDKICLVAPTSVKSWARQHLPLSEQHEGVKANGDPRLVVMKKNHMVMACEQLNDKLLEGYNASGKFGGKEDLADAYLIGRCQLERIAKSKGKP